MTGLTLAEPQEQQDEPQQAGTLEERARIEWPYTVEVGWTRDLDVDHRYQRPGEEKWVNDRVDEFDPSLVGSIDVSEREDGTRWIMDGQQRWLLTTRNGLTTMHENVYRGLTLQDEAGFFARKNEPKPMNAFYKFRARMMAGDLEYSAINEVVESAGYKLGPTSDHNDVIGAMAAVMRAFRMDSDHRDECLSPTLRTLRATWHGRKKSLSAPTIVGFASFWRAYADDAVDHDLLVAVLADLVSPDNLLGLARERMAEAPSVWRMPQMLATIVAERYNRQQRVNVGAAPTANSYPGKLDLGAIR